MEYKKVNSIESAASLTVDEETTKEMILVEPEQFEGVVSEDINVEYIETLYALSSEMVKLAYGKGGIGIALPQIGINKRAFLMVNDEGQWELFINPEYFATNKYIDVLERSISYSGIYSVKRSKRISTAFYTLEVDGNDRLYMKKRFKQMSGLRGFVFQSLVDILNGKTGRTCGVKKETSDAIEQQS